MKHSADSKNDTSKNKPNRWFRIMHYTDVGRVFLCSSVEFILGSIYQHHTIVLSIQLRQRCTSVVLAKIVAKLRLRGRASCKLST